LVVVLGVRGKSFSFLEDGFLEDEASRERKVGGKSREPCLQLSFSRVDFIKIFFLWKKGERRNFFL